MKHSNPFAAALLMLASAAAQGQGAVPAPADSPPCAETASAPTAAHAGTRSTCSVLKLPLPPVQLQVQLQPGQPSDPNLRVTEPKHFIELQARIAWLRTADSPCPHQYHVAKAQAWLNFSRDQYHERAWQKDIQRLTFDEARRIVEALEAGQDPGTDTPLLAEAQRIRPDLWALAQRAKDNPAGQLCCVQSQTAFCEVKLVWSGHALANLGGWRRAASHVRMAEDLCQEARQSCPAPTPPPRVPAVVQPPPVPLPPVAAAPPPAPPRYEKITLAAGALFAHAQSSADQMLPAGRAQLELLVERLGRLKDVERMLITGHADVTNSTGDAEFNDKLSMARANAVRSFMSDRGADVSRTEVASAGDRQPIKTDCPIPRGSDGVRPGKAGRKAMQGYHDCLQPNRRVEIEIFGTQDKR